MTRLELPGHTTGHGRTDQANLWRWPSGKRCLPQVEHADVDPVYVFSYSVSPAATNDKAEWRLLPTVVFRNSR
jgi:hypothetical protein